MPAPTDTPTPLLKKLYRAATNPIRLLPDFIIIGTQRGGTTSLYSYLVEHPGIGAASIKEVHYFDTPHYKQGLAWYQAHFPSLLEKYYAQHVHKLDFMTGEASPYYLFHPHVPRRVANVLPEVKLIVMLRNPVDRAYSHYHHERAGGHEHLATFEEAIEQEERRLAGELDKMQADEFYASYPFRHFSYLARGIYIDQLQRWLSFFPREQVLILKSEDFYANPAGVFQQTLAFLNVSTPVQNSQKQEFKQYNLTTPPSMDAATRAGLLAYFAPYNAHLYEFLGRDFGWEC
jgi:Sulfotransferase domain